MDDDAPGSALYDGIAPIYDPWSRSVVEDVDFYVEEALASGGPVVELAVGTGRIAVPIAKAGVRVIGVDESPAMLEGARAYAERENVAPLVDLRLGDLRDPPVEEHEKLRALTAAASILEPGGRFVFDVFAPSPEDIEETDGRWLEREPGIFERADWDLEARLLVLSVRGGEQSARFALHWLSAPEWNALIEDAGLVAEAIFGWFDRRPYDGGEDQIWICRRPG